MVQFARQHCYDTHCRKEFGQRYTNLILRNGCVGPLAEIDASPYVRITIKHAKDACALSHTDTVRYLLRSGLVDCDTLTPRTSHLDRSLLELTTVQGPRSLVTFFFEIGGKTKQQLLVHFLYALRGQCSSWLRACSTLSSTADSLRNIAPSSTDVVEFGKSYVYPLGRTIAFSDLYASDVCDSCDRISLLYTVVGPTLTTLRTYTGVL
jgi:hypothetical protein